MSVTSICSSSSSNNKSLNKLKELPNFKTKNRGVNKHLKINSDWSVNFNLNGWSHLVHSIFSVQVD